MSWERAGIAGEVSEISPSLPVLAGVRATSPSGPGGILVALSRTRPWQSPESFGCPRGAGGEPGHAEREAEAVWIWGRAKD